MGRGQSSAEEERVPSMYLEAWSRLYKLLLARLMDTDMGRSSGGFDDHWSPGRVPWQWKEYEVEAVGVVFGRKNRLIDSNETPLKWTHPCA